MTRLHNKYSLKNFRNSLRNRGTPAEAVLWTMLSRKQVGGLKFRRQHSIGHFVVDFYSPELKLAIELDGAHHITYAGEENDVRRDAYLASENITVLHFENRYVFDFPQDIIDAILKFKELKMKKQ